MSAMKDSGIPWIGMIPEGWKIVRLRHLCSISTGNQDTQDNNENGIYPFFVRSPKIERSDTYSFNNEAVLMAGDGVGAGKVFHHFKGKYACHQRVYSIQPRNTVHGKFLYFYLLENFYKKIEEGTAKSTVDSVRLPMLKDFYVSLPPLETQQRIADYLDEKCAKIEEIVAKEGEVIEKLKAYKLSLITETVTKGLDPNAEMKDSGIEWIGMIPEGWEVSKAKYLGEIQNGLTYSPLDVTDENNDGVLVLRSSNIQNEKLSFTDNVFVKSAPRSLMVEKSDIIICARNGSPALVGKCAIVEAELNACYGAFMLRLRPIYKGKYTWYVLIASIQQYKHFFSTSTINQLTIGILNNLKLPFTCNLTTQQAIADYLDEKCAKIDETIAKKQALIEKLGAYKKSLIYEVVTGKKEV